MKKVLYIGMVFTFLLLQGCVMNNESIKVENKTRLNDIWALKKMTNESLENMRKPIAIEFDTKNNRFHGIDGCNRILGSFDKLTNSELTFGLIKKTMRACIDMKIPTAYVKYLEKVKAYKIDGLKLYLMDENHKVLLEFLKVD